LERLQTALSFGFFEPFSQSGYDESRSNLGVAMPKEPKDEPTQYTEQGLEIPVPTRDEIESALEKIARPQVSHGKRRRRTKQQ
jgi:hypothetical protein